MLYREFVELYLPEEYHLLTECREKGLCLGCKGQIREPVITPQSRGSRHQLCHTCYWHARKGYVGGTAFVGSIPAPPLLGNQDQE